MGRMYLPPLHSEANVIDGFQLPTVGGYRTAVDAFRQKLADSITTSAPPWDTWFGWEAQFCVYSRTLHQRAAPNWWFDIKSIITDSNLHYLRSRVSAP